MRHHYQNFEKTATWILTAFSRSIVDNREYRIILPFYILRDNTDNTPWKKSAIFHGEIETKSRRNFVSHLYTNSNIRTNIFNKKTDSSFYKYFSVTSIFWTFSFCVKCLQNVSTWILNEISDWKYFDISSNGYFLSVSCNVGISLARPHNSKQHRNETDRLAIKWADSSDGSWTIQYGS